MGVPHRASPVPAIVSTDLYYSIKDVDDHFDVALFLQSPEFQHLGLVLDNHFGQDGERVVEKLSEYSGRAVPVARGIETRSLTSLDDRVEGVPCQDGVDFILRSLERSATPVVLIAIGSMTDIAAAVNRAPELFGQKLAHLYVVAGFLHPAVPNVPKYKDDEYNVLLDLPAFLRLMRSGLPLTWVPCDSSRWLFDVPRRIARGTSPLCDFLLDELYWWHVTCRNFMQPEAPTYEQIMRGDRYERRQRGCQMFSTPAFVLAGGGDGQGLFEHRPARVSFHDTGRVATVLLDHPGANMRVVTRVEADPLNAYLEQRLAASREGSIRRLSEASGAGP